MIRLDPQKFDTSRLMPVPVDFIPRSNNGRPNGMPDIVLPVVLVGAMELPEGAVYGVCHIDSDLQMLWDEARERRVPVAWYSINGPELADALDGHFSTEDHRSPVTDQRWRLTSLGSGMALVALVAAYLMVQSLPLLMAVGACFVLYNTVTVMMFELNVEVNGPRTKPHLIVAGLVMLAYLAMLLVDRQQRAFSAIMLLLSSVPVLGFLQRRKWVRGQRLPR